MNPYLTSRLADDRLADDRLAAAGGRRGDGEAAAWRTRSGGPAPTARRRGHGITAATNLELRRVGRVRRVAGWMLVDAGLRLVVGRPGTGPSAPALRG